MLTKIVGVENVLADVNKALSKNISKAYTGIVPSANGKNKEI